MPSSCAALSTLGTEQTYATLSRSTIDRRHLTPAQHQHAGAPRSATRELVWRVRVRTDDEGSDADVVAASLIRPGEFGVVFDRHFQPIYRYLARRMSVADASDLAGEAFRIGDGGSEPSCPNYTNRMTDPH